MAGAGDRRHRRTQRRAHFRRPDSAEEAHARFLVGNAERLVGGAREAARWSQQELGVPAQLSIVVSCFGRRVVLGQQTEEELEGVREIMGSDTVITGFYSYGEISGWRLAGKPDSTTRL